MAKRPVIGVTPGMNQEEMYLTIHKGTLDGLAHFGAAPVLLPMTADEDVLSALLDTVDGVLFSGGGDVDPMRYGQYPQEECGAISPQRDAMELTLCRMLLQRGDKPVLGICRGFQVMNIALGGTLHQDVCTSCSGAMLHRQRQPETYVSHPVEIVENTLLHRMLGETRIMVNSLHHQAIDRVGEGMTVCAKAPDGIIEAGEWQNRPFFVGVQWHPERLWTTDCTSQRLFLAFVEACKAAVC